MIKKTIVKLCLACILAFVLKPAKANHADSLYQVIKKETDFYKISLLTPSYVESATDSQLGRLYFLLGWKYGKAKNVDEAFKYYNMSRKYYKSANDYNGEQKALENIGAMAVKKNNYTIAEKYFREALEVNERWGDELQIALSNRDIGYTLSGQGKKSDAVVFFNKAVNQLLELEEYEKASVTFVDIGNQFKALESYQKAEDYYSLAINHSPKSEYVRAMVMNNMSEIKHENGQYEEAVVCIDSAINIKKRLGDEIFLASSMNNLGIIHYQQGHLEKAFNAFYNSFQINVNNPLEHRSFKNLSESYSYMDSICIAQGQKYRLLDSGVIRAYRDVELAMMQDLHLYAKKDMRFQAELYMEHQEREQEETINTFLFIALGLISLAALAFYMNVRRERKEKAENNANILADLQGRMSKYKDLS